MDLIVSVLVEMSFGAASFVLAWSWDSLRR